MYFSSERKNPECDQGISIYTYEREEKKEEEEEVRRKNEVSQQ